MASPASRELLSSHRPPVPEPIHLRPTAELAERVLLPGDPGRALALAQALIGEPRMFNHHRGLWGYTGPANLDGELLTIQSTGMGGPSAAIVLSELVSLGARRAIRVGTCGALDPELALGDLVIARAAICGDGASRALASGMRRPLDGSSGAPADQATAEQTPTDQIPRVAPDRALTESLIGACPRARAGTVLSVDLFYDSAGRYCVDRVGLAGGQDGEAEIAIEMECATLFALGVSLDVEVACVLAVTDTFAAGEPPARIDDHSLLAAAKRMGAAAVAALAP